MKEYQIPQGKIGVIPYNVDLQIAAAEGRIIPFLNRNYLRSSRAENDYFMGELKNSVIMLKENMIQRGRMKILHRRNNNE